MARVCGVLFVPRGQSSKVFDPKGAVGKGRGGAYISELENRALGLLSVDRRRLSNRRLFGFRNDLPLSPLSLAPYSVADDRPQEWPKTAPFGRRLSARR